MTAGLLIVVIFTALFAFLGFPAALLLGTIAAVLFLPGWHLAAVTLLAAILSPTDAALGQAVVSHPIVPARVRRALTLTLGPIVGIAIGMAGGKFRA